MKSRVTSRQKKIAALIAATFVVGAVTLLVGRPLVAFASAPEKFRDWVDSYGILSRVAYVGMVILQVIIALIPGEPFEIAAGYAFGALEGTLLCILASGIGSMLVFFLVRRYGMRLVEVFFSKEKLRSLRFLRSSPKRDYLFLTVFMIPGTPKDLLCYFAGLTDMKFPVWTVICTLGRIPSIITSTIGGNALGKQNYLSAVIVFATTLAVSSAGILVYNALCKRHAEKKEKRDEDTGAKQDGDLGREG